MGIRRRKHRTHTPSQTETEYDRTPKSFVIRQGKTSKGVKDLVSDVRSLMMPWTAKKLKERNDNTIRDFIDVAGPLKVTHILLFTQKASKVHLRIARLPQGPTISFEVSSYSLSHDIRSQCDKQFSAGAGSMQQSPLVVLSGFKSSPQDTNSEDSNVLEVMRKVLSGLFPSINIDEIKKNSAINRRVVLFLHKGGGLIEVRQYTVHKDLKGVSPIVRQMYHLQRSKKRKFDFVKQEESVQVKVESNEDEESTSVTSPSASKPSLEISQIVDEIFRVKKIRSQKRRRYFDESTQHQESVKVKEDEEKLSSNSIKLNLDIDLVEIGPRLSLNLLKIEADTFKGDIFWQSGSASAELEQNLDLQE